MATLVKTRIAITNLVSSSGAARLQVFGGNLTSGQWLVVDCELTAAQNAAMQTALAAAANTTTNFDFPSQEAPLPGLYNSI
jgi:hypothetical protein